MLPASVPSLRPPHALWAEGGQCEERTARDPSLLFPGVGSISGFFYSRVDGDTSLGLGLSWA